MLCKNTVLYIGYLNPYYYSENNQRWYPSWTYVALPRIYPLKLTWEKTGWSWGNTLGTCCPSSFVKIPSLFAERRSKMQTFTDDDQNDYGHWVITIGPLSLRIGFATKLKCDAPKVSRHSSSNQKGWCNKPTKFKSKKISQSVTNQSKSNVELRYMAPPELLASIAVMLVIQKHIRSISRNACFAC